MEERTLQRPQQQAQNWPNFPAEKHDEKQHTTCITIIPLAQNPVIVVVNSRAEMDVPFVSLQRFHGGG